MTAQLQVWPAAEQVAQLAALVAGAAAWNAPTVDLFINNVEPSLESVDADFTLADGTSFPGYATSSAVTWAAGLLQDGTPAQVGSQKIFVANAVPPAPLLVYGFVLKGTAGRRQYCRFETPIPVVVAGDYVPVNPVLTVAGGILSLFL